MPQILRKCNDKINREFNITDSSKSLNTKRKVLAAMKLEGQTCFCTATTVFCTEHWQKDKCMNSKMLKKDTERVLLRTVIQL